MAESGQIELSVDKTHHDIGISQGEYIAFLHPTTVKELNLKGKNSYIMITNHRPQDMCIEGQDNPSLRTMARVITKTVQRDNFPNPDAGSICIQQTLRHALMVDLKNKVLVRCLKSRPKRNRLAKWLRYQYIICRCCNALPTDMEKQFCRLTQGALDAIGIHSNDMVVVEAVDKEGNVREVQLRAPVLTSDQEELRQENQGYWIDGSTTMVFSWKAAQEAHNKPLPEIHLDAYFRNKLGIQPGDPVWVRRSAIALFTKHLGEIAITFALSLIGLGSIVEFLIEGKWNKFLFFATIPAGMIIIAVFLLALKIRSSIGQHE